MALRDNRLTDDEATFLALLARVEPATAHQLSKIYADSPVSNFGTSKGKIYPLVRRLKQRGLIDGEPVASDARKSELLRSSSAGREAVRQWIKEIRPGHLLPEDPLRTMVQSLPLLPPREQTQWVSSMEDALQAKLAEVECYGAGVTVPFKDLVHDSAVSMIRMRLKWLGKLRDAILEQQD